jgi:3-oxoacyl-[acyl-carrier-protein] synthase-1
VPASEDNDAAAGVAVARPPAYVLGGGLVTALGRGLPAHAQALARAAPDPATSPVSFAGQAIPYHFAAGRAEQPDSFRRLVEVAAEDALADAALPAAAVARMGVFVGSTSLDLPLLEGRYATSFARGESPVIQEPGYNTIGRRIAQRFGLRGPRYAFSTACSSSANAVLYARALLAEGRIDHALVIGADGYNRLSLLGFAVMMLLSRRTYRPFDRARDGMVLGEGVGALVLGREPAADRAAVVGGATACDPSSPTGSSSGRIAEVMQAALADAGLPPGALVAIKAHGTGTPGNDLSEGRALLQVFGDAPPPLTSIKPFLGYTLGACGAIELLAMLAAWRAGFLPATPGFTEPDESLGLRPEQQPRALGGGAMLCNFIGFGGNNTSLVLAHP